MKRSEAKKKYIAEEKEDILESVLLETENRKIEGVVTGTLKGFHDQAPLIEHMYSAEPQTARSLVTLTEKNIKREVALMFENGDPEKPLIMGLMQEEPKQEVFVDGEKQEITAESEILLRCGKSSILLRKDGKIIIKGTNIISRAQESNKIRGGSVKIN